MLINSITVGIKKGLHTTWTLGKIIVPVYFFVTILKHTPIIDWISVAFEPMMGLFNLPGEAVLILVLGNFLDPYAAIGAIKAISLTSQQITTIAVMLGFSHALFIETAIAKKLGINILFVSAVRLGLAIIFGILVGRLGGLI